MIFMKQMKQIKFKSNPWRQILFALCVAMSTLSLFAQSGNISGTVTDKNGEPLPGVIVSIKGTTTGVATDANGKYAISVPDRDAVLVFSFMGYVTQEVLSGDQTIISVSLSESITEIDEVVVVAYGTMKKANLTGAVDQLRGDKLENRPIVSVPQALQGMIGGLNITSGTGYGPGGGGAPGAQMSVNLRGFTGLNGGNGTRSASPLVVVDGIQGQDINTINPDDIATISVLKDAASAAIYGSSAPFGVILITTKQGAKNARPTITYSANLAFASPINLPTMLGSVEFAELLNEINHNSGGGDYFSAEVMQRIRQHAAGQFKDETVPTADGTDYASYDGSNANNDWFKLFYKDRSFSHQHNIGISGGSENTTYYVGAGYNFKDGMYNYGDDSFKRFNIRTNLSSNLLSWLTANVRSSFKRDLTNTPSINNASSGGVMHDIARTWPTVPLYNPDGHLHSNNRIALSQNGGRTKTTNDVTSITGELVVTPLKGWNTTFNYTFKKMDEFYSREQLQTFAYRPDGTIRNGERNKDDIFRQNSYNEQHTVNLFTSYEYSIGDHNLQGLAGFAQELYSIRNVDAISGSGYLYVPGVPAFGTMYDNTPGVSEGRQEVSSRGVFGRINYNYKEKYLLELNGRYDGNSRFLKDVRFKFYPGMSAAWVISKEGFWNSISQYANLFKVRASYGSLGDISAIGYYPFYPSLGTTTATDGSNYWFFNGERASYITPPGMVNDQLTWVTTTTLDFGTDVELLKSRLTASFDWFRRYSDDIVGPAEQKPAVLGAPAPSANNAALETNGFELTLGWRDRISDFSYGIRATLADTKSTVKKYPNEKKTIGTWYDGAVIGDIWGYETEGYWTKAEQDAGIDQNRQKQISNNTWYAGDIKYVDRNKDGVITPGESTLEKPGDRKIIGNNSPRYSYGATLDAAWKGFDFSMFLQGIGKRDAYLTSNYFWGIPRDEWQMSMFTVHRDRWTPDNPNGYFPRFYMTESLNRKNQVIQTKYLQDASYMRLKNLQLGYTIPQSLLSDVGISKLRFYVSGENLATITSLLKTIDPEFAGTDGKIYPLQRTWSFGLNLTF
jgi:TonB-linked SusC/RagA family outer membrane protein